MYVSFTISFSLLTLAPGEMEDQSATLISDSCLGWKNAQPMPAKSKSGAMQVMDEMGIFSVVCCHGIVQLLIDMVQSGEL